MHVWQNPYFRLIAVIEFTLLIFFSSYFLLGFVRPLHQKFLEWEGKPRSHKIYRGEILIEGCQILQLKN